MAQILVHIVVMGLVMVFVFYDTGTGTCENEECE